MSRPIVKLSHNRPLNLEPTLQIQADIEALPNRQRDVLEQITRLTEEHRYPPTLAELAKALGLKNRMTVHQHVAALKKKGLVHWEPGLNRSLKVIGAAYESFTSPGKDGAEEPQPKVKGIPLAGAIAAGMPIDALETDEYLAIDQSYTDKGCFALTVKGDSMIEDGIYDGDYVIVKPNSSPGNGDIVVALLEDGSATLKRFFKENGRFRLQPANSTMKPIFIDSAHELSIQGVVVALFRKI